MCDLYIRCCVVCVIFDDENDENSAVCGRAVCGAHGCGVQRLHGVEFDAIPHHAAPLPSSARCWLFAVETCFVVLAVVIAAFLTGRNAGLSRRDLAGTAEETVPLAYLPGQRRGRRAKDTVVMQMGAGHLTKATARMMCDPHVQLLAPLVFYTGVSLGFVLNDFTVVSAIRRHLLNTVGGPSPWLLTLCNCLITLYSVDYAMHPCSFSNGGSINLILTLTLTLTLTDY